MKRVATLAALLVLAAACGGQPPATGTAAAGASVAPAEPGIGRQASAPGTSVPLAPSTPRPSEAATGAPQPGTGAAPSTLSGEFVCLSGSIAVVRMPGPFTIGPLKLPSYWEPDLRFAFKDGTTWTDLTFPTRPLDARYDYDPATGALHLFSQPGPSLYRFEWKHDGAGEEYLIQVVDEGASSQYFCRKVGPP